MKTIDREMIAKELKRIDLFSSFNIVLSQYLQRLEYDDGLYKLQLIEELESLIACGDDIHEYEMVIKYLYVFYMFNHTARYGNIDKSYLH